MSKSQINYQLTVVLSLMFTSEKVLNTHPKRLKARLKSLWRHFIDTLRTCNISILIYLRLNIG